MIWLRRFFVGCPRDRAYGRGVEFGVPRDRDFIDSDGQHPSCWRERIRQLAGGAESGQVRIERELPQPFPPELRQRGKENGQEATEGEMNQLGTDVLAMAVIVGGAAVGGASTLLFLGAPSNVDFECSATVKAQPRIVVVSGSGESTFVVAPEVELRSSDECSTTVRVDRVKPDRAPRSAQRVLARAERVRERVGTVHRIRVQSLADMDFDFNFEDHQGTEIEVERRLEEVMRRLEERLVTQPYSNLSATTGSTDEARRAGR
jgi:hypothetical protein